MTMADRVAALFTSYPPGTWIDGRDLATVGGYAAWRSRISDLRRAPYGMTIENRTRRVKGFTVSEYRWVVRQTEAA